MVGVAAQSAPMAGRQLRECGGVHTPRVSLEAYSTHLPLRALEELVDQPRPSRGLEPLLEAVDKAQPDVVGVLLLVEALEAEPLKPGDDRLRTCEWAPATSSRFSPERRHGL